MGAVFAADRAADVMLTLATTGWITGQSYMLVGPLVAGVHCVMLAGSPVYPTLSRFAQTIERQRVTIFKKDMERSANLENASIFTPL